MERGLRHVDCRNYAPMDVVKGLCHLKKQLVPADEEACDSCERLPKCAHCRRFLAGGREYLGTCTAGPARPMAYPDMAAVTCEDFAWKEA
jgi:4-hydroxyphenylacetate decarboxylase small subunit